MTVALREAPEIWDPLPLSATANSTIPSAPCERCGCSMSIYREAWETWCWPCQSARPGLMPPPAERPAAAALILSVLLAAGGAATAQQIRASSGLNPSTVKDALRRLIAAGSVTASDDRRRPVYRLAAQAEAA